MRFALVAGLAVILIAPADGSAQTSDAARCETEANRRKSAWQVDDHSWFANEWQHEAQELSLAWCRMRAAAGAREKAYGVGDLGRILFTGDGLRPVFGTVGAGSGLGAGGSLTYTRALSRSPIRLQASVEALATVNGSYIGVGQLELVGSAVSETNSHTRVVLTGGRKVLQEIGYFGLGSNSLNERAAFSMRSNTLAARLETPRRAGVSAALVANALWLRQGAPGDPSLPAAGLQGSNAESTDYVVLGAGGSWNHPSDEVLFGLKSSVALGILHYQDISGRPLSFQRWGLSLAERYSPETTVDFGTFAAVARIAGVTAREGNEIPFYLYPSLGGADAAGVESLRSYTDYRFRDRIATSASFEYERSVLDPIGIVAFLDVGGVADRVRALSVEELRRSYGLGISVRVGGLSVFRFLYAFGGAEGARFHMVGRSSGITNSDHLTPF